jgi:protein Tex
MSQAHVQKIAVELGIGIRQVEATIALFDEGGTVPFIARYRKEATGSLDEVEIMAIRDRLGQLRELDRRREAILNSLEEQGKLTDELREKVLAAETMAVLEDIYLPYRPKRRTRAMIAREKGLEPLADRLLEQEDGWEPVVAAEEFVDAEEGAETAEEALAGARDIIAERVNEDQEARGRVRELFSTMGNFRGKVIPGKEEEGSKYRDYFDWEEPVAKAPSHRILAMRRGEKEQCLTMRVVGPEEEVLGALNELYVKGENAAAEHVKTAVQDAYKRLLSLSMETELRVATKQRADEEAIRIFAENLRQLLLASPLGEKRMLGLDPGFRTGCKLVCLDRQGKLVHTDVIFPDRRKEEAEGKLKGLCKQHEIEAIAIGNGTGGRETEAFVRGIGLTGGVQVVMVNESGASVYSASEVAREEFPDHDLTVRGAVSIGRRLMDPLAELVKIDPKSIGVGQYQHDVDQNALKQGLDDVVVICVNSVGVEVNTASKELLTYVSGLGPQLAKNIVDYRNENGPFKSRKELGKVPRLGPKAFELAGGFLRIRDGANPLDASAVHPESYPVVDRMARDMECEVGDLIQSEELRSKIELARYVDDKVGLPTLGDIMEELAKPGRDPRQEFVSFSFAEGVEKMEDLVPGMKLPGIVTNITAFGAFVDIGVHQDGLIHISQLADRYVKDPIEVVKVHQQVEVRVLEVDLGRQRIALSMKREPAPDEKGEGKREERQKGTSRGKRGDTDRSRSRGKIPQKREEKPDTAMAEALKKLGLGGKR